MTEAERREFDEILEEILGELPDYVRELLEEVPVVVEDEPSHDVRADFEGDLDYEESDLCGLHHGLPLTEKGTQSFETTAPLIMLFRGPIGRLAGQSKRELRKQIRITLLHEIGHHFGFTEEDLEAIGYA